MSLVSYPEVGSLWEDTRSTVLNRGALTPYAGIVFIIMVAIYAGVAILLSFWSIRRLRATWGRG